jgi:hypothetical protein
VVDFSTILLRKGTSEPGKRTDELEIGSRELGKGKRELGKGISDLNE